MPWDQEKTFSHYLHKTKIFLKPFLNIFTNQQPSVVEEVLSDKGRFCIQTSKHRSITIKTYLEYQK